MLCVLEFIILIIGTDHANKWSCCLSMKPTELLAVTNFMGFRFIVIPVSECVNTTNIRLSMLILLTVDSVNSAYKRVINYKQIPVETLKARF